MSTTFTANTDKAADTSAGNKQDEANASMHGELLQRETKEASHQPVVQTRLAVGATDDPYEKEADSMADKVMRMPAQNFVQRKCADCEEEEKLQRKSLSDSVSTFIQAKSDNSTPAVSDSLSQSIQSSRGSGSAMDGGTQSFMASRFNTDFSGVKIHTGSESTQMNKELNARAFTVGNDIYFNDGQYQPGSNAGKHLLAHELTHTIQQGNGINTKMIQRDDAVSEHREGAFNFPNPVRTSGFDDTSANRARHGNNYWDLKISSVYDLYVDSMANLPDTMNKDGWSSILAKGWELRPMPDPSATSTPVTIGVLVPVVPGTSTPYRAHCTYAYSYDASKKKPALHIDIHEFIREPSAITDINASPAVIAKKIPKAIYDTLDNASHNGIPGGDIKKYFVAHPEVKQSLAGYIEYKFRQYKATKSKDVSVTTELATVKENTGGVENKVLLILRVYQDRDTGVYNIDIKYSSDKNNAVTPDYNQKDYADFQIEKDAAAHPGAVEKFGGVRGLDAIADPSERTFIKNQAVNIYTSEKDIAGVKTRSFRDVEIDQVFPFSTDPANPAKTELTYYTFIVHKPDQNNLIYIDVKRIGKKGDAVVGDPSKQSITRIPGYAENAFKADQTETPDNLITWLLARYKGVTKADITGTTVADVTSKMNAIIDTRASTPDWYKKNYSINILDATDGAKRLKSTKNWSDAQVAGMKDYSAAELNFLELALQRFNLPVLKRLANLAMVRQATYTPSPGKFAGLTVPSQYTYNSATKAITPGTLRYTVIIYDSAFKSKEESFLGGTQGVNTLNVETMTHELGHVVGHTNLSMKHGGEEYVDKFNKFYKDLGLTPVTEYAKDTSDPSHSPDTEFFPEAFMLFMNDPEFLLTNQPPTYFWFMFLQQTGSAPSLDQAKSMRDTWEKQKTAQGSSGIKEAVMLYALWKEYAVQKAKVPDADNTATLILIISEFQSAKNRPIRMDEIKSIVTKWQSFVTKNKKQPTNVETITFFP